MKPNIKKYTTSNQPHIAYNASLLLGKPDSDLKKAMLKDNRILSLIKELKKWPGEPISSHKSARQLFHKLSFLADLGLTAQDLEMNNIIKIILKHKDENGIPQLPMNIPKAYGGTGNQIWAWALCDAPTTLYSLLKMGYSDQYINNAIKFLADQIRDNGWRCTVSKELGNWRGPGKKSDPCPYATLIMTKLLLQKKDEYKKEIETGAETLLSLWEKSLTDHPYIFYMGTDFRKIKLPFVWYDILHIIEVLSQVKKAVKDKRFKEMIDIVASKSNESHEFIPESIYTEWKNWDFGQKKQVSEYMSFCIDRILFRIS